ncbi:MAG: 8-oxo-dGTP diphosphatase, partial [Rickettsiales bacterium]|nr:8-oxo-dGTP diphosphatase [Rickettsiales bacterium]
MKPIKNTANCCLYNPKIGAVLLGRKLQCMGGFSCAVNGRGKDLYYFPGGKLEHGESFAECAIRETMEETGLTPVAPILIGKIQFEFPDLIMNTCVFWSDKFTGKLIEKSDELENVWVKTDAIPYDNMWPSERYWVPKLLAKTPFSIRVINDGDNPKYKDIEL